MKNFKNKKILIYNKSWIYCGSYNTNKHERVLFECFVKGTITHAKRKETDLLEMEHWKGGFIYAFTMSRIQK